MTKLLEPGTRVETCTTGIEDVDGLRGMTVCYNPQDRRYILELDRGDMISLGLRNVKAVENRVDITLPSLQELSSRRTPSGLWEKFKKKRNAFIATFGVCAIILCTAIFCMVFCIYKREDSVSVKPWSNADSVHVGHLIETYHTNIEALDDLNSLFKENASLQAKAAGIDIKISEIKAASAIRLAEQVEHLSSVQDIYISEANPTHHTSTIKPKILSMASKFEALHEDVTKCRGTVEQLNEEKQSCLKRAEKLDIELEAKALNLIKVQQEAETQSQNVQAQAKQSIEEAHEEANEVKMSANLEAQTHIAEIRSINAEVRAEVLNQAKEIERRAQEDTDNVIHAAKQIKRDAQLQMEKMALECYKDLANETEQRAKEDTENVRKAKRDAQLQAEKVAQDFQRKLEESINLRNVLVTCLMIIGSICVAGIIIMILEYVYDFVRSDRFREILKYVEYVFGCMITFFFIAAAIAIICACCCAGKDVPAS